MFKLAASALGASLLLATPASADGWGRPGWGGGWGPPVGWAGGGGGCCSPCGGGVGFAPVVSYQPVVVVGGCGGWGGGCGAGWGGGWGYGAPGWGGGYGWSAGYGRGYPTGYGPAYAHWGPGARAARASYGFGPGVRVTRVTRVGIGPRPGIVGAGFRR
jgi:hypothetical protein